MLTKQEEKNISKVSTLLTAVKFYILESIDGNDFYNETGITIADIEKAINRLNRIHTNSKINKQKNSMVANKYNKKHPEVHRIHNNISYNRQAGNTEKLAYWQKKLEEYKTNNK